ncbi:hypothetical protein ACFRAE_05775 [Sphingobacterium sp. HJSM2_6]|uniref:hypothetical protein n=1 Tax=Sphingobacterium sp. HJSM2_6 TaxID=3366264 RepID=UPI003BE91A74
MNSIDLVSAFKAETTALIRFGMENSEFRNSTNKQAIDVFTMGTRGTSALTTSKTSGIVKSKKNMESRKNNWLYGIPRISNQEIITIIYENPFKPITQ